MADADWDFIYDGVIGFLTSPIWQIPIMSFLEKHCIVFDPSEENCHSWGATHKEYKVLVESLLASYLKDVGITEEQFVSACSAQAMQGRPQMQVVFEQIWAAEDFEIFKRMMVQRNIELELQALQLIQQQQGYKAHHPEPQVVPTAPCEQQLATGEDEILKEVLRRSKVEFELMQKETKDSCSKSDKDMEKDFADSHEDNMKILSTKAVEKKEEMKRVVADRVSIAERSEPKQAKTEVAVTVKEQAPVLKSAADKPLPAQKLPELAPVKSQTSAEAVASWLSSAKSEVMSSANSSSVPSTNKQETEDVKRREEYLKKQRDRLLALKNKEREKRLDSYVEKQPKRPTSARVARQAVQGTSASEVETDAAKDGKKIGMSKALADRLKKEVVYK